jgi:transcriptional regulator with XRE-family HTH domain
MSRPRVPAEGISWDHWGMTDYKAGYQAVVAARERLKWTKAEAGRRLGARSNVLRAEQGRGADRPPTAGNLCRALRAYDVPRPERERIAELISSDPEVSWTVDDYRKVEDDQEGVTDPTMDSDLVVDTSFGMVALSIVAKSGSKTAQRAMVATIYAAAELRDWPVYRAADIRVTRNEIDEAIDALLASEREAAEQAAIDAAADKAAEGS